MAYSTEPLLMYPTHYTSEAGYISDTERSSILSPSAANCTAKSPTSTTTTSLRNEL